MLDFQTIHLRLKNDTKPNGAKVSAKAHADYILREGESSQKSDCIFQGHQLPSWAYESAQKFFRAADRYEDKGNRRYKEIEFSLPNELTLEQNREIVDRFIACHLTNHYYAYAIHEKSGAISGERHPHVHIMFSERLIDDVEKMKERLAYKYFTRSAKPLKGEKVASFERRREHGAPKDKRWHSKKFLYKIREDFAEIQNGVLAKNGYSVRVDHRTLKAQKMDVERKGDDFLTKIFDRIPETYLGITSAHSADKIVDDVKKYRESCQQKQSDLFQSDLQEKIAFESEQQKLQSTKNFLVGESDRLEKICQTDGARQKISLIAAGILKKNLRIVNEYENEKIRSKDLFQKLRFTKNRLEQLKENCPQKLKNKFLRVIQPNSAIVKNSPADKNLIASIIADALSGEQNAVQLVAYSSGNTLEMEKSWNLMSDLDKDELIHKKIMREL